MVTRSIVGRVLILAVLVVSLGVIAQAALIIEHGPAKKSGLVQAGSALSGADQQDTAPIRVVYPGPLGDSAAPARKIADAAPASPLPVAASPVAMPPLASSSVGAITQASASQEDFDTGEQKPVTPSPATPVAMPSDAEALSPAPTTSAVEVASADPGIAKAPVQPQQTAETSGKGCQHQQRLRRSPQPPARRRSDRPNDRSTPALQIGRRPCEEAGASPLRL